MGLDASYNFTSPGGKREKFSLDILFHRTTYLVNGFGGVP